MLFVTFHKSNGNVHAYKHGEEIEPEVLDKGGDQLRGIFLEKASGTMNYLYVADGSKDSSNIYLYQGNDTSYKYVKTLASSGDTPAILHPFAITGDNSGRFYVSNQNTNMVVTLIVDHPDNFLIGPIASYLTKTYPNGKFLDGTLVASSQAALPNAPQTNGLQEVPVGDGGLGVEIGDVDGDSKVLHSVRDVVTFKYGTPQYLFPLIFVADEVGGVVRLYDPDGNPLMCSTKLADSPVHLLIKEETIYVSAGEHVLASALPDPSDPNAPWEFTAVDLSSAPPDGAVSGMTFDDEGNFFIAVRTTDKIMKYEPGFRNGTKWASTTHKGPEFLLHVSE